MVEFHPKPGVDPVELFHTYPNKIAPEPLRLQVALLEPPKPVPSSILERRVVFRLFMEAYI
ncbi:hypothetical protein D3C81_1765750 [compost metagenome]